MHILYRTSSWAVLILVAAFAFAQLATAAGPGIFSPAGNMVEPRVEATATLLPNGKVLIAGGGTLCCSNGTTASAGYDPNAGTFTATGNMTTPRQGATAVLLADGKVLIASGGEVYSQTATAPLRSDDRYVQRNREHVTGTPRRHRIDIAKWHGVDCWWFLHRVQLLSIFCGDLRPVNWPIYSDW